MRKLLIALSTLPGFALAAPTYAPFHPEGGIAGNTTINAGSSSLSGKTAEQWGNAIDANATTAGAAIPKTWIGANTTSSVTGVAPLDASGNVDAPITGNASSALVTSNYDGATARKISDKWGDHFNLADLGATLNNSVDDKTTIQTIYSALPSNSLIEIPKGSTWDGTINNPDPTKHETWLFYGGLGGFYPGPTGDGDTTIQLGGAFNLEKRDLNTKSFSYPSYFFYWNADANYCGAWCSNYQQYSAANFRAISGPTSTGNTSPATFEMDSYGQGPSSAYDVVTSINGNKYGQNSMWGIVDDLVDFSAKAPGAFSMWNEYDMWANGDDVFDFDPNKLVPHAGARSSYYLSASHLNKPGWYASTSYNAQTFGQQDLSQVTPIAVSAADGVDYLWYPVKSGTSAVAASAPTFPVPTKVVGTYDGNTTLTITSVVSGKINIGDWVTAAQPIHPFQVVAQVSGTTGGAGVYTIKLDSSDKSEPKFTSMALYVAPRVTDNTVIWQFGEKYNQSIGSVMWLSGNAGDSLDYVVTGKDLTVNGAVIDSSLLNFNDKAAVVRMAPNQKIDLSYDGSNADTINKHVLTYNGNSLSYNVNGSSIYSINDAGVVQKGISAVAPGTSSASEAPQPTTPIVVLNPTTWGQGVNAAGIGTAGQSQTFINNGVYPVAIYPYAASWAFSGKVAGDPVYIDPGEQVTVTSYSNYSGLVSATISKAPTKENVDPAFRGYTLSQLTALTASNLVDGQHARCTDCILNGLTGVDVVWNASSSKWTDSQNANLAN